MKILKIADLVPSNKQKYDTNTKDSNTRQDSKRKDLTILQSSILNYSKSNP